MEDTKLEQASPTDAAPPPPAVLLDLLTWQNPVLRQYAFWTAILVIKMLLMSFVTAYQRYRTRSQSEDEEQPGKFYNEKVERTRRAHRNDLENVIPYILISFVYTLTNPFPIVAINLFRGAVAFRLWHSFVYALIPIRQPARLIGYLIPLLITIYMAIQSAIFFVN